VHIEQANLSKGSAVLFKDYGDYVCMAYDPSRTTEEQALKLLVACVPCLGPAAHRAGV
jgi:hypothetical protein